ITPGQMNPNSAYYLSFDLGYPNAYDRSWGRTGAQLMVHGDCSSRGCYSMTDEQISEIYALGRDAFFGGQKSFQVQAFPFHMTAQNMARHRNNPNIAFWKMLKKGSDHFEVSGLEPKVNVCERHYVFDAESPNGRPLTFSASGKCPTYRVPEEIASLVKEKEQKDDQQFAELTRRNVATAPVKTYADGGMNEVFMEAVRKNQIGVAPQEASLFVTTPPGTIPTHVRPPAVAELADAPVMAGVAKPTPPVSGEVSPPAMAIADTRTTAAPVTRSNGGGLFGSLFASKSSDPAPAAQNEGTFDRMKRLVGLQSKDKTAQAKLAPKPKPAAKPTRVASHGAIRPKSADAEPLKATEAARATTAAATPVAAPAPVVAQKRAAGTAMNGSAPVVPAGNFDNRWSGFR
ncbi:MAG: L,D-transpeptidase family protein, partial [Bradyrhizobium sp.]